jgi:hypothetical protein
MTMTIHIALQMKRRYFTLHWLTCVIGIDFCQFAPQWAWLANKFAYRCEGVERVVALDPPFMALWRGRALT